jgi:Arc/MetJ-type ribon-helix-helix transcriptional regulator
METEKVSVNLPPAELGKIDVLIAQGLYTSRTDLIRAGIRQIIDQNTPAVEALEARTKAKGQTSFLVGMQVLESEFLEGKRRQGKRYSAVIIGTLKIDDDVTPELGAAAIGTLNVFGTIRGPREVIARLGSRIKHGRRLISGG